MTLTSRPLAFLLFLVMFGGIAASSAAGWWQTEGSRVPAAFTEGEFAGQANPADIRGSYTFGDISTSFSLPPDVLARAFQVSGANPAAFAVKDLEGLYLDRGYEIGTGSVRLFVAWYAGLPFDTAGEEIFLPRPATDILLARMALTAEQAAYLQAHTVEVEPPPPQGGESAPEPQSAQAESGAAASDAEDYVVKGKTVFGDLIRWGVPRDVIEQVIGASMPDPTLKVKDYATGHGLSFEALRVRLQAEVDRARE